MNSIARALNNIALSITRLSEAISNSKKEETTNVISSTITSNPLSTVTITTPKKLEEIKKPAISEPFRAPEKVIIHREERDIIDALYKSLTEKGINPAHHDKMLKQLSIGWPVLYKHLDRLIVFRKNNYNKTYSSYYPHSKDAWK